MSAKKTAKPSTPQQAPDVQHQFIVLATKHMAKIGKQLEQGQGDKEEHYRVLEVIAKDIGKAIKGMGLSAKPGGDISCAQCYPNYINCMNTPGSDPTVCRNNYITCTQTCS